MISFYDCVIIDNTKEGVTMNLSKQKILLLVSIIPHMFLMISALLDSYSNEMSIIKMIIWVISNICLLGTAFAVGIVAENNKSALAIGISSLSSYFVLYYIIQLSRIAQIYYNMEIFVIVLVIYVILFAIGFFIRNIVG